MLEQFIGRTQGMRYRLALDIGTASCGLVAVSLDNDNQPTDVVHHSVHIFPEPLLPAQSGGVGEPKKAARRKARMARRIIERRARRLKRIAMLASLIGLDHRNITADSGRNIHALRAQAATSRVNLDDLIRVLLKLAKRRGYAGGFKTKKSGVMASLSPVLTNCVMPWQQQTPTPLASTCSIALNAVKRCD